MEYDVDRPRNGVMPPLLAEAKEPHPAIARLEEGLEVSWKEFLDACAGVIFRVVRTFARSYDDRMDLFLFICDGLQADGMRRVRGFRRRPDAPCRYTTWLMVVVRNLALDQKRSREGRFRPFTKVRAQDDVDRIVSEYRWRDGRSLDDVRELLWRRHGLRLGPDEVAERAQRIERSLSASQRWRLLARFWARQPALTIDAEGAVGSGTARPPLLRALGRDPENSLRARDAGEALTRAVEALTPRQRLVLALRFRDGLEVAAAARTLGATSAQIERSTRDGLDAIRAALGAEKITRDELEGALAPWWLAWEEERAREWPAAAGIPVVREGQA